MLLSKKFHIFGYFIITCILCLLVVSISIQRLIVNPSISHNQIYSMVVAQVRHDDASNKDGSQETRIDEETYSPNEWMDRSTSKIFRRYKNSSACPGNPYRNGFRELLHYWIEIAERLKIRYFLTDGTLLGAWRDADIIPYDFDLDIRIHVNDLPKLLPLRQTKTSWNPYNEPGNHLYFTQDWRLPYIMRRRFSCLGKQVNVYEGECSFTDPPVRLINDDRHIDIFVYQTYENVVQFFPTRQAEFLKTDVFPLVKCSFINETAWCPRNPKHILDQIYQFSLAPGKVCKDNNWVDKT